MKQRLNIYKLMDDVNQSHPNPPPLTESATEQIASISVEKVIALKAYLADFLVQFKAIVPRALQTVDYGRRIPPTDVELLDRHNSAIYLLDQFVTRYNANKAALPGSDGFWKQANNLIGNLLITLDAAGSWEAPERTRKAKAKTPEQVREAQRESAMITNATLKFKSRPIRMQDDEAAVPSVLERLIFFCQSRIDKAQGGKPSFPKLRTFDMPKRSEQAREVREAADDWIRNRNHDLRYIATVREALRYHGGRQAQSIDELVSSSPSPSAEDYDLFFAEARAFFWSLPWGRGRIAKKTQ